MNRKALLQIMHTLVYLNATKILQMLIILKTVKAILQIQEKVFLQVLLVEMKQVIRQKIEMALRMKLLEKNLQVVIKPKCIKHIEK